MFMLLASVFTNELTAWATVGAAVGTISAVAIVLYRDSWRAARRRPQLSVGFANNPGYIHVSDREKGRLPRFRLSIANAPGRDTAHDVEVLVSFWSMRHPPPELGLPTDWDLRLENRSLVWANEYESGELVTRATIPPGVSRQVEFVRFGHPRDIQRVIDGVSRAIERPPELHDPKSSFKAPNQGDDAGFEVKDDYTVLVAPPFDGSDKHILQWHVAHRFRLVVTLRDADSVAYDTVLQMSVSRFPPEYRDPGSLLIAAEWAALTRAGSPNAAFSHRVQR